MWATGELIAVVYLAGELHARVVTELPHNLDEVTPLVRVHQPPGGGDDRVSDVSVIDVDCFGHDRASMWALTGQMRAVMHQLGGRYIPGVGVTVDTAITARGPGEVPYRNDAVRRTVTTYRLTCRALG